MKLRVFCKLLILLTFLLSASGQSFAATVSSQKSAMIESLLELIDHNETRLSELDEEIKSILMQSHNLNLSPKDDSKTLGSLNSQLSTLSLQRREHYLRQNFLDRLKFQVDRKFKGQNPKTFLSISLLEMAQTEATSIEGDIGLSKFCNNLSLAIKQIPEKTENMMAFIEGYIKFSSILDPKPPTDFLKHRSYTNGFDSYSADPISREDVGDLVEKRLKEVHAKNQLERKVFENRKPILKPLEATLTQTDREPYPETSVKNINSEEKIEATIPQIQQTDSGLQLRLKMDQIHSKPSAEDSKSQQKPIESRQKNFE